MAFPAYGQSFSGPFMAPFTLALLPLLAEAAFTFLVCRRYLHSRPPAASIPASITSILLINVFLTLLLLCSVLGEGAIMSATLFFQQAYGYENLRSHLSPLLLPAMEGAPTLYLVFDNVETLQKQKEVGDLLLDLLALAMVWMVVLAYVGAAVSMGLHVSCSDGGDNEKNPWNKKAMRGMMRMLDRSKWVGLCLAVVFSTWACFHGGWQTGVHDRAGFLEYAGEGRWQGKDVVAFLLAMANSEKVWRWTAASSTLILLALVSLYTIAARLALYLCCRRFSLQLGDAEPLVSSAC